MKQISRLFLLLLLLSSCSDIVGVEDISEQTVIILAPANDITLVNTEVNFSWNSINDAERYKLQIAVPDFENTIAIVEDTTIAATSFSKVLSAGNYEWRLRAENSGYQTAYTTQSFSITESDAVNISNEEVILLAPANAVVFSTTDTINFSWETVLNAKNYTIQITTPDFPTATTIIENEIVTETSFSVSNLETGNYQWRVKAQNSEFQTDYTTQNFVIE